MVVVLPTPFTPTTRSIYGCFPAGVEKSSRSSVLFSSNSLTISSRIRASNSLVLMYLSLFTRSSIRSMILMVVSSPTSEAIKIASSSSRTSTSTVDLPATALVSLSKNPVLVFSKPWSSSSSFFLVKNFLKKLIFYGWEVTTDVCHYLAIDYSRAKITKAFPKLNLRKASEQESMEKVLTY